MNVEVVDVQRLHVHVLFMFMIPSIGHIHLDLICFGNEIDGAIFAGVCVCSSSVVHKLVIRLIKLEVD